MKELRKYFERKKMFRKDLRWLIFLSFLIIIYCRIFKRSSSILFSSVVLFRIGVKQETVLTKHKHAKMSELWTLMYNFSRCFMAKEINMMNELDVKIFKWLLLAMMNEIWNHEHNNTEKQRTGTSLNVLSFPTAKLY